ncbi:hypothetical protein [Micromonospora sp. DPT]|uniref:hypothetical protein n=1 Tax=Micromonospora sp. DPT TaxID=3142975 RepID=UPI00320A8DCF
MTAHQRRPMARPGEVSHQPASFRPFLWHTTSAPEAKLIRPIFSRTRIEIRQNEVSLPPEPMPPVETGEPVRLVFIGRINPIKSLSIVLADLTQAAWLTSSTDWRTRRRWNGFRQSCG